MPTSRARSFGAVAAAYAEHRPGYPAAALDWALAPVGGSASGARTLLDLGAGTGKLTTALLGRGDGDRGRAGPGDARRAAPPAPRRRRPGGQRRVDPAADRQRRRGAGRAGLALVRHRTRAAGAGSGAATGRRAGRPVERRRSRRRVGGRAAPGGPGGATGARHREQRGAAGVRRARRLRRRAIPLGSPTRSGPGRSSCWPRWPPIPGRWSATRVRGTPRSRRSGPTWRSGRRPRPGTSCCR